jgi:hypothetical protein
MTPDSPTRRLLRRLSLPSIAFFAGALAAGCVASPGSSGAPTASGGPGTTPPTGSPSAPPTASPTPTDSPTAVPTQTSTPSTAPIGTPAATCGVASWKTGPTDLVLRITVDGGLVAPGVDLTNLPVISVYGDGSVLTEGVHTMIYPGPLVSTLNVQRLTPAGMRSLLDAAAKAGLLVPDASYPAQGIADAPTTTFRLNADGCTHTISAYALQESDLTDGLDQQTIDARAALLAFENHVADLGTLVGPPNIADAGQFRPTAYRVIARRDVPTPGASSSFATTQPWPLTTPLATFGKPMTAAADDPRCGVVDGADATTLAPLLAKATVETNWSSAGATWSLLVRPLLPDESHTCGTAAA